MIYAVCGPASLLSTLVVNVARALLERVHGEIFFHHTNDANDLRNRMASGNLRDGLITFDVPDHIISQLILRSRTPTILVLESMAAIYVFNRHAFGMDYLGASRQISRIFSVFRPLFDAPNVLILNMTEDQSFERLVGRVASGLHLNVSEEDINSVMVRVAENFSQTATIRDVLAVTHHLAQDVFDGISNLPVDERRTLVTLEQGYGRLLSQKEMPALKWPTELLINAENSSQVSSPLDLTGPGRLLTFGPYMCLPIGEWRAQVALALKDNLSNNIFMCDIYSPSGDEPLAVGRVDLPVSGYFKTSLNFTVKSASDAFEFRTFMPTGAIEGVVEIVDITMHLEN